MRILGLDVGTARIGVAVSDESHTIASPLSTIDGKQSLESTAKDVLELCKEHSATTIVIGMPITLSGGNRGESAVRAQKLGNYLKERGTLTIVFWDERFTTKEAERALIGAGVKRSNRRQMVDKVAASLILQGYLDKENTSWE